MGVFKTSRLALLCLLVLALFIIELCHAQNSPQDYVNAHNRARAQVGVGPIRWDNRVAVYARNYISKFRGSCRMVHSGGPYGENLAWGSADLSGVAAVNMWVREKSDYNYNSNKCRAGKQCGHYTQVVWRKSVRLGCAKVRCNNGGTLISCNYDPPGNYNGQRPYDISPFEVPLSYEHDMEMQVL